MLLVLVSYS